MIDLSHQPFIQLVLLLDKQHLTPSCIRLHNAYNAKHTRSDNNRRITYNIHLNGDSPLS